MDEREAKGTYHLSNPSGKVKGPVIGQTKLAGKNKGSYHRANIISWEQGDTFCASRPQPYRGGRLV